MLVTSIVNIVIFLLLHHDDHCGPHWAIVNTCRLYMRDLIIYHLVVTFKLEIVVDVDYSYFSSCNRPIIHNLLISWSLRQPAINAL